MQIKRLNILWCIILTLSILLSACVSGGTIGGETNSGEQDGDTDGGTEISIALHDSPWKPALEKMIPLYEEYSGNTVKLHVFPYDGLFEKYVTESTVGSSEFDVAFVDNGWLPLLHEAHYLTPIHDIDPNFELDSEILEYDYFTRWNNERKYPTEDGELMVLPINGNLQLLYYRKDILDDLGVEPPKTWEDVLNIAKQVHDPENDMYGFVTGGQTGNRVAFDFLPFLFSHGGSIFADPENGDLTVTINNDAGERAVNTWLDLMTNYGPPGVGDVSQADVMSFLGTGKVAMGLAVAASYSFMDDPQSSIVENKIEFIVPPAGEGGQPASGSGPFMMGVPQESNNKEAALDFMKWITSKEVQMEFAEAGAVPIRNDVYESELAEKPELRYLKAMQEAAEYSVSRPGIRIYSEVEDIMGLHLNMALIGQISGEEALDKIAEEVSAVVGKN